jgi:hypothetical protein
VTMAEEEQQPGPMRAQRRQVLRKRGQYDWTLRECPCPICVQARYDRQLKDGRTPSDQ